MSEETKHDTPTFEWREISPAMARSLLENLHESQRPLAESQVRAIAEDIENGRWSPYADTIHIDVDGRVVNGQHRLNAIMRANRTVRCGFMMGVPRKLIEVIDTGKPRSARDSVGMAGVSDPGRKSATANCLLRWWDTNGRQRKSRALLLEFIRHNEGVLEMAIADSTVAEKGESSIGAILGSNGHSAVASAFCFLVQRTFRDRERVCQFFGELRSGVSVFESDPVIRLRNKMTTLANTPLIKRGGAQMSELRFCLACKAAAFWFDGVSCDDFRWNPAESWPVKDGFIVYDTSTILRMRESREKKRRAAEERSGENKDA